MRTLTLLTASVLVTQAYTLPALEPRINIFQDVLLFDGLAFTAAGKGASVALQSFVYLRQISLDPLAGAIESALQSFGVQVGDKISVALDRVKLVAAVPLDTEVKLVVNGCNVVLDNPDHGMALRNLSLCNAQGLGNSISAHSQAPDGREFTATVFATAPDGFGIISDIDDTVKVTQVLEPAKALENTLLASPQPVIGMPQLYASLSLSLGDPLFVYLSGSPFQFYPFLHDFIHTNYPKGPLLLQNLTLTSLSSILDFTKSDGVFEYKSAMIDRIRGMYPKKKFLVIGDSTQKDPESYGLAFRKYGDFIRCIWIRRVEGSDNSPERFAKAFLNVPTNRFRIYNDTETPSLQQINVATSC